MRVMTNDKDDLEMTRWTMGCTLHRFDNHTDNTADNTQNSHLFGPLHGPLYGPLDSARYSVNYFS